MRKKRRNLLIIIGCCFAILLTGCASIHTNTTSIQMSYSGFDGTKTKDICLNFDENQLKISGSITMSDGKVRLYVSVKDTGEELYSQEYSVGYNGKVNIDIGNLQENKALVLGLDATNAKDLKLDLIAKQTLIRDPEKPSCHEVHW
ncbi:hypothetical protein [Acetanaerobacterium elongatum]|uniref:Uncharacterized protein n=1 Tax=Acetanaerobacterium elongatum TaxID=258515 RepID=A0A1G9W436_9FIRM|nr:hypothetical protein [Acetanaerobacterium elongatum]SDM78941.1 hypothetical protein SAMN05192585_10530 [Acetanaerobacterium elongatum]